MRQFVPLIAMSGLILFIIFIDSSRYLTQQFLAYSQVYFDFGNASDVSYETYENTTAGIRIKYPSNWAMLENLGNISGNSIIADFYNTGINGTHGYSENANVVVLNQSEYLESLLKKYKTAGSGSFAIQPTRPVASIEDASKTAKFLTDETLNSTIAHLKQTFSNVTLLQSISTVISGLPGYQITYLIADNQTDIKQTQAWTFKDDKWYVITYSAQPSAYYSSTTAINIINSIVLR
jgi:photosystem II reaction center protein PsbP